jgi:phenylpropionate dioxygenase-like ring-hydroxylating dioxygenase large terminal subunit
MTRLIDTPSSVEDVLETGLLNNWYLVCRDTEVGSKPLGLKRLNRDIVIWRDKSGKLNAVEDFCPHRGARLSLGHVCDGDIACEYHGVQVNGQGVVTATPPTPGSPMVGKKLISSYPIEQRHGAVWVYFSDGYQQGEPPPLQFPEEYESGEWSGFVDIRPFKCNWQLVRDNQFDPIHGSYLHVGTHILSAGKKEAELGFEKTDKGFVVWRKNQQGVNLDKTWLIHFPGSGFWAITDLPYPRKEGGGLGRLFRFPTPIDRENTLVWNYRMQKMSGWKRDAWRFLYKAKGSERGAHVLEQDRVALEGIPRGANRREHLLQCDIGVAQIRRLYREEAERQLKASSSAVAAE